ncbi:MAG: hypothetical protein R6V58_17930 [Planctomycetota bacterium]
MARRASFWLVVLLAPTVGGCVARSRLPSYKESRFRMLIGGETRTATGEMSEDAVQKEVDRLLAMQPARPVPAKVLLYEVESSSTEIESAHKRLLLRKETAAAMKAALEKTGLFEQIDFLPDIYLPPSAGDSLKTLRIAAARAHADGLLLYATETGYEVRLNWFAALYPTILGAFVAPGTREAHLAESKAVLVDVKTGYIYQVFQSYGDDSRLAPPVFIDSGDLEYGARKAAMDGLAALAAERVAAMGGGAD